MQLLVPPAYIRIRRPLLVAIGATGAGSASATFTIPSETQTGDLMICSVCTEIGTIGGNTQGFSSIDGSDGNGLFGTSSRLELFSKTATGSDANPSASLGGSHVIGNILTFRRAFGTINAVAHSGNASSTSITFPSVTTTVDNCLILNVIGYSNTGTVGSWSNANLTDFSMIYNDTTTQDDDGGIAIAMGYKTVAGSTGSTTATLSSASTQGRFTIAIAPATA